MKRFNSQSQTRKVKRGHLRFVKSKVFFNKDGTAKIATQERTKRGFWNTVVIN